MGAGGVLLLLVCPMHSVLPPHGELGQGTLPLAMFFFFFALALALAQYGVYRHLLLTSVRC